MKEKKIRTVADQYIDFVHCRDINILYINQEILFFTTEPWVHIKEW
jgi:hypothetical protein